MNDDQRPLPFPFLPVTLVTLAVVLLGGGILIALINSGGDDDGTQDATPTVVTGDAFKINIADFLFDPVNVSVSLGATVSWLNSGAAPHDATARDGSWATVELGTNDSGVLVFNQPGTWEYFCTIHPYMEGTLTVRED